MITLQQLVKSIRNTDKLNGVITKEEAQQRADSAVSIMSYSITGETADGYMCTKALFFTDDYLFGHNVLPKGWVGSIVDIPMRVVPRPELPSGWINTVDDYITVFHDKDTVIIETLEELVDYVNSQDGTN